MNVQAYIESGVLEMYALDQLDLKEREEVDRIISGFPELKIEIESIHHSLEMYAVARGIQPHARVKASILESISDLEKEAILDLQNLPVITAFSDYRKWLLLLEEMIPAQVAKNDMFTKVLQQSEKVVQLLVVATNDIDDEVHGDSHESFLILKGRCKCTVGNDVRFMEAGDFMTIPLHEHHDVQVLSDSVVAIVQHVTVD